MKSFSKSLLIILLALPFSSMQAQSPRFSLRLETPSVVTGQPGDPVSFEARLLLDVEGVPGDQPGAEALSASLRARGCEILGFDTRQTASDPDRTFFSEGHVLPDGSGATFAVVKSTTGDSPTTTFSPDTSPHLIAILRLRARVPADDDPDGPCQTIEVAFEDGVPGPVRPLDTIVTYAGQSFRPSTTDLEVAVCDSPCSRFPVPSLLLSGRDRVSTLFSPLDTGVCWTLRVRGSFIGQPVALTLEHPAGESWSLWATCEGPADPGEAELGPGRSLTETTTRLLIPEACSGVYQIRVLAGTPSADSRSIRLTAAPLAGSLESMSPRRGAVDDTVRATIRGTGFDPATSTWWLEHAESEFRIPHRSSPEDPITATLAEVDFDIPSDAPAGVYDLVLCDLDCSSPEGELDRLPLHFQVHPDRDETFEVAIDGPDRFRVNRPGRLTLRYLHTGTSDLPAPILRIVSPVGTRLRLGRDPRFAALPTDPDHEPNVLQVLAVNRQGRAGVFAPGTGGEIPLQFTSTFEELERPFVFLVERFIPVDTDPVPYDLLRPAGIPVDDWESLAPALEGILGTTWGEYRENLARLSTRLARRGHDAASLTRVFRLALLEAFNTLAAEPLPAAAAVGHLSRALDGARLPEVTLLAFREDELASCSLSGNRGRFALKQLEAGETYRLEAPGFTLAPSSIEVPPEGDLPGLAILATPSDAGAPHDPTTCPPENPLPFLALEPLPLDAQILGEDVLLPVAEKLVAFQTSWDPNEKRGPRGRGKGKLIDPGQPQTFSIHFENEFFRRRLLDPAPAQRVEIVDELDLEIYDVETITFRDAGFADVQVFLDQLNLLPRERRLGDPACTFPVSSRCDLAPDELFIGSQPFWSYAPTRTPEVSTWLRFANSWDGQDEEFYLHLTASIEPDPSRGVARLRWVFQTYPRSSSEDCEGGPGSLDDLAQSTGGFLPPNRPCVRSHDGARFGNLGEGHVSFTVKVREDRDEGVRLRNTARITFDGNERQALIVSIPPDQVATTCLPGDPAGPTEPDPAPGQTGVSVHTRFSFTSDCRADLHDFFLYRVDGETMELVEEQMGLPSPLVVSDLATTGGLEEDTEYRWQIVSHQSDLRGEIVKTVEGPEWTFVTEILPRPCPEPPRGLTPDGTGGCGAVSDPVLRWQPGAGATSHAIWLGRVEDGAPVELVEEGTTASSLDLASLGLEPGVYLWQVVAMNEHCSTPSTGRPSTLASFEVLGESTAWFLRGDASGDGTLDIADVIQGLLHQFAGHSTRCEDALDVNDDGQLGLTDSVHLLLYLFRGEAPPVTSGQEPLQCETDRTADCLTCEVAPPESCLLRLTR